MKGCVITAFHSQVVTGESDRTHRLHTNDQFKPVTQLKAVCRHPAASAAIPDLAQSPLILHLNPVSASGPTLTLCQWPGPRSIDLCFRFSAEACEAVGHWATVCSLQQTFTKVSRHREPGQSWAWPRPGEWSALY